MEAGVAVTRLSDVLASCLTDGPRLLEDLIDCARRRDDRVGLLSPAAVERILAEDPRFERVRDRWALSPTAPVPGARAAAAASADGETSSSHVPVVPLGEVVVVDVEATDTDPARAELIEIGALVVDGWEIVDRFHTFVRAADVPAAISALTGIETVHLAGAPPPDEAVARLVEFVGARPVLGQNVGYDLAVLHRVDPSFEPPARLEVLELAHIVHPRMSQRSLEHLARHYEIAQAEAHRAVDDCVTTVQVAHRLVEELSSDRLLLPFVRELLGRTGNPWAGLLPLDERPALHDPLAGLSSAPWLSVPVPAAPRAPSATEAFRPEGRVRAAVPGAEHRPAQQEMAETVEEVLGRGNRRLIEAPTGTGKTYAYLVPAIGRAAAAGRPVWVSTNTKALQTQLQQDFERLSELGIVSGSLAVLKGRENYLCTRDLLAAADVVQDPGAAVEAATLLALLGEADLGELGEVSDYWLTRQHPAARELRATVTLNPDTCEGARCEYFDACPYFASRRRAATASIVAVNHALLVRELGEAQVPDDDRPAALVVDEAHTLEDAATSALTEEFHPSAVGAWLDGLIDERGSSGLLRNVGRAFGLRARHDDAYAEALAATRRAASGLREFTARLAVYLSEFVGRPEPGDYPVTHRFRPGIDDRRYLFLEARQALFAFGQLCAEVVESLWELFRLTDGRATVDGSNARALRHRLRAEAAHGDRLAELALRLLVLSRDDYVAYVTWETDTDGHGAPVLTRAPVDVTPTLRRLYDQVPAVVATSATLTVGGTFDFMRDRLAAGDFTAWALPETFDYSRQAALFLTRHLPAPLVHREAEFVEAVAETAVAAIGTAGGGTLALFAGRRRMLAAFELAEPGIRYEGLDVRAQAPGASTRELADWFRSTLDGSLFGLRSFWEGFDAPGDTLRLLLIEKLPFPSPGDPLVAARMERIDAAGGDPFRELTLPLAALSLKQGFGRLIRSRNDRGAVVLLDRRLRTGLTYQSEFLDSLPSGLPLVYPADEDGFLLGLAERLGRPARLDLARGVGPRQALIDLADTTIAHPDDPGEVELAFGRILAHFGMTEFRPGQESLIRSIVVDGRDAVGVLPTGAGKSLVYQAAAMCLDGVGVVVSPLVALIQDQIDTLRSELGFRWAHALYGGQSGAERDEILDAVREGGCRLLYVSPERLRDPSLLHALGGTRISFVAVDEAHCVSVWGHDFRPDFLTIVPSLSSLPRAEEVPRVALTATAPPAVLADIVSQLRLREPLIERRTVDRPNLHLSVIRCSSQKEKRAQLLRVALAHQERPGIVYCATRRQAEAAAALLRSHGVNARHYHAGMPPEQRHAVQELFMLDEVQVICATNAFGLGIDKPDIGFVAHWALPMSLDSYFQEAGRAARDPKLQGVSVLLWTESDTNVLRRLADSTLPSIAELDKLAMHLRRIPTPYATVEDLTGATGLDDVGVRVGIHLLEWAGAIRQGATVGARAMVVLPASARRTGLPEEARRNLDDIADMLGLTPGRRKVVDLVEAASSAGMEPTDLESRLLDLAADELVGYRPFSRALRLDVVAGEWDRDAVTGRLAQLQRASSRRLEAMVEYVRARSCRRRAVLTYFDEEASPACGNCDACTGLPDVLTEVDPLRYRDTPLVTRHVRDSIVGLVREASRLRSTPSRGSFVKGLAGIATYGTYEIPEVLQRSRHFASLSYLTQGEILQAVYVLIGEGLIVEIEHQLTNGRRYVGLDIRTL